MKIMIDGIVREMTKEEIIELQSESIDIPVTNEKRIAALEAACAEMMLMQMGVEQDA